MRKWFMLALGFLAVSSFSFPHAASAQSIFLGAGATFPTGDYADYADTGWMVDGGFGFALGGNGFYGFIEGLYGSNSHDLEGDKTNLLGGFGGIEYVWESGLFAIGQLGFLRHDFKSEDFPEYEMDDTGFAFGGGLGYSFPLASFTGWVLGRYLQAQFDSDDGNTSFFGLNGGISIPLGGGEG